MSGKNPVVHFEMPYEDADRVAKFYQEALDWTMLKVPGDEYGGYITAQTTETDENRLVQIPGTINGGFFPKKTDWPARYPSVVIAVDDMHVAMKRVKAAGGEVLGDPMDIPGIGVYVSFLDTEGNRASLMQSHDR